MWSQLQQTTYKQSDLCVLHSWYYYINIWWTSYINKVFLGKHEVFLLKETSTCSYEIIILTPLLCSHPKYKPKDTGDLKINCLPLEGAEAEPYSLRKLKSESAKLRKNAEVDRIKVGCLIVQLTANSKMVIFLRLSWYNLNQRMQSVGIQNRPNLLQIKWRIPLLLKTFYRENTAYMEVSCWLVLKVDLQCFSRNWLVEIWVLLRQKCRAIPHWTGRIEDFD